MMMMMLMLMMMMMIMMMTTMMRIATMMTTTMMVVVVTGLVTVSIPATANGPMLGSLAAMVTVTVRASEGLRCLRRPGPGNPSQFPCAHQTTHFRIHTVARPAI